MNKLFVSFLAILGLTAMASPETQNNTEKAPLNKHHTKEVDDHFISVFKGLNFDKRSELREYLFHKTKTKLSFELISFYEQNSDIVHKMDDIAIMALGRSLNDIKAQNQSLEDTVKLCGFHRLADFYAFKKDPKNKSKFYLDNKTPFYASALVAEMWDFEEASSLFEIKEWLSLKKDLTDETLRYQEKHPGYYDIYHNHLRWKANQRILSEIINNQTKSR